MRNAKLRSVGRIQRSYAYLLFWHASKAAHDILLRRKMASKLALVAEKSQFSCFTYSPTGYPLYVLFYYGRHGFWSISRGIERLLMPDLLQVIVEMWRK